MELFRPLALHLIASATFSHIQSPAALKQATQAKRTHWSTEAPTADIYRLAVSPDTLSYFLTAVVKLSPASDGLAAELTAKLCVVAPLISGPERICLWNHVLRTLVDTLESNSTPLDTKCY